MPAIATSPVDTQLRLAGAFAAQLAQMSSGQTALVVVADPVRLTEIARCVVGPAVPLAPGELLELVLPSEAMICPAERLRVGPLRTLAEAWAAPRLLLAPCTFGHDLLAVGVCPLRGTDRPPLDGIGRRAERLGAALTWATLSGERRAVVAA